MISFLSEADVKRLVNQSLVNNAIEEMYRALGHDAAMNFPVVREKLSYADAIFGFKSGFIRAQPTLGVKAGGLWPGNKAKGMANHQSTIVLFDPENGAPSALVCGTYLTALRTAAASALSIRYLARSNATTLGILGSGGQAEYQLRAALSERDFQRVLIASRTPENAGKLVRKLADTALEVQATDIESMCREADVIITTSLSFAPVVAADWIAAGTHLACMGTDSVGKQEVNATLLQRGRLFGDAPEQNRIYGECQHWDSDRYGEPLITPIGAVVAGSHPGRVDAQEITLFDSTGIGLQDVAAARLVLSLAYAQGSPLELDPQGDHLQ